MTPTEYREALAALNLSQVGAARLFGVDPRTSRHWAAGSCPPQAVALCLRLMLARGVTVDEASNLLGKKP